MNETHPSPTRQDKEAVATLLAQLLDTRQRGDTEADSWQRVLLDPRLRADLDSCLRVFELLEPTKAAQRDLG